MLKEIRNFIKSIKKNPEADNRVKEATSILNVMEHYSIHIRNIDFWFEERPSLSLQECKIVAARTSYTYIQVARAFK